MLLVQHSFLISGVSDTTFFLGMCVSDTTGFFQRASISFHHLNFYSECSHDRHEPVQFPETTTASELLLNFLLSLQAIPFLILITRFFFGISKFTFKLFTRRFNRSTAGLALLIHYIERSSVLYRSHVQTINFYVKPFVFYDHLSTQLKVALQSKFYCIFKRAMILRILLLHGHCL